MNCHFKYTARILYKNSFFDKKFSLGQDEGIENDISIDDMLSHDDEEETEVDGRRFPLLLGFSNLVLCTWGHLKW